MPDEPNKQSDNESSSDKPESTKPNPAESPDVVDVESGSGEVDHGVFDDAMKKRIEQAKSQSSNQSVDQMLQSMKPTVKKSKKKFVFMGIAAALVLALGGGFAAFALVYQNPDNAITDSMAKALSSKTGTIKGTASYGSQLSADFTIESGYKEGSKGNVTVNLGNDDSNQSTVVGGDFVMSSDGNGFFKPANLEGLVRSFIEQITIGMKLFGASSAQIATQQEALTKSFEPLVTKLDGKWLRYGLDDIMETNEKAGKEYKCTYDVFKKVADDQSKLSDVGAAYFNNRFVVAKESLGVENGNSKYVIDLKEAEFEKFMKAVENTALYKEIDACSDDEAEKTDETEKKVAPKSKAPSNFHIEVRVDYLTHQLKSIHVRDKEEMLKFNAEFTFNQPVKVDVPSDFIRFTEAAEEVQTLLSLVSLNPFTQSAISQQ